MLTRLNPDLAMPDTDMQDTGRLTISNLSVSHHNARTGQANHVLNDISLEIPRGEFLSIVGPSGCGKTTFLNCIAGLQQFAGGEVLWDGQSLNASAVRRAVVFQSPTLLPWRTVSKNISYSMELQRSRESDAQQRIQSLVSLVGLGGYEHHYPHELSGGMQQRVNLARALAIQPRILLMDEPFSALDNQTRNDMQSELLRIWEHDRKTVIFVTHQVDEAVYLSDRVLVLNAKPSRVEALVKIDIDRPRDAQVRRSAAFHAYVDQITDMIGRP